jgi:hypothetical protein
MNWEAVSALASLISAIAVALSLIYLALQIRAGTRSLRTTMRDSAFHSLSEWNFRIMADPDLAYIFQQGSKDFQTLDARQRARFIHVMFSFYKMFENIYLHFLDGSVGPEAWQNNRLILDAYSPLPGAQHYWRNRGSIFDERFRALVDSLSRGAVPAGHEIVGVG